MQPPRSLKSLRMHIERILEKVFPRESGAARLQQIGLFSLIYVLQGDKDDVTARRLSRLTGQPEGDVGNQVKRLIDLGLLDRTQILNKQGRGRAYKLTIKRNAQTKRLTKVIDKAAASRKRR
jgi:predicted transcriptional regulator